MRTPYDSLMRLHENAMSEVRVAINVQIEHIVTIENHERLVESSLAEAHEYTTQDALIDAEMFVAHVRAQRARLAAERAAASARLNQLRARALEAYGALRAARHAAELYRSEAEKSAGNAEQHMIDDLSAAHRTRPLRLR
jgi:hypothetical protein